MSRWKHKYMFTLHRDLTGIPYHCAWCPKGLIIVFCVQRNFNCAWTCCLSEDFFKKISEDSMTFPLFLSVLYRYLKYIHSAAKFQIIKYKVVFWKHPSYTSCERYGFIVYHYLLRPVCMLRMLFYSAAYLIFLLCLKQTP